MVATRRGARHEPADTIKASEASANEVSSVSSTSSHQKTGSRKSPIESPSETSNESPPEEPEISEGEQQSLSSEVQTPGPRRLTRSRLRGTSYVVNAAEFNKDGDVSEAESTSSAVSDVHVPGSRRLTRSRHSSAASGLELCTDSRNEAVQFSEVQPCLSAAHEFHTPSTKKTPKRRQTEAEALLDTFVTTILEAEREVGSHDHIPGSQRISRSRIGRGAAPLEPTVEQQAEEKTYPLRTSRNVSQSISDSRLFGSAGPAPASPKLTRIRHSKIVPVITESSEEVDEGSEAELGCSSTSASQKSKNQYASSSKTESRPENLAVPDPEEPKITTSVIITSEVNSPRRTRLRQPRYILESQNREPVGVATDSPHKVEVIESGDQTGETRVQRRGGSRETGTEDAIEVVDVTDKYDAGQSEGIGHSIKTDMKRSFKKTGILSLSSSEDDDDAEADDENENVGVFTVKNGAMKSRSKLLQSQSMDGHGLFVIDKAPGLDTDRKYYLEPGGKVEEDAEKSGQEDESSEEEEDMDKDFVDEDEDIINKKSGVINFSTSIDAGISLKELGGLYISFDAEKTKTSSSALLKKPKAKSKTDELLKKSIITPDFEKGESVPPFKESLRQLKKHRKEERAKTAGDGWFGMKAPEMTDELKNDLKALKMRAAMDPKRFYKKNDREGFPKYFQIGTVVDTPVDFYHARIPKKQRKRTMVEELLADSEFRRYNKKKYQQIMAEKAALAAGKKNRIKKKFHK